MVLCETPSAIHAKQIGINREMAMRANHLSAHGKHTWMLFEHLGNVPTYF
jgi:hypothetical protein